MDGVDTTGVLTLGRHRYDRRLGQVFRSGAGDEWGPVPLGSRAADLLAVLAREPGALVSKTELMDVVWPGVIVEANNLTVQIAALRRVLDAGADGPSCIQTIPGRGYRLLCHAHDAAGTTPIAPAEPMTKPVREPVRELGAGTEPEGAGPARASSWVRRHRTAIAGATLATLASAILALALASNRLRPGGAPAPPRMSVLVRPFANLGSADDARIAAAITDDLKAALPLSFSVRIVAGDGPPPGPAVASVGEIGRRFGARYVVVGSERRLDGILRVNAQIVSTETANVLWTDRFDVSFADQAEGQEQVASRLQQGIVRALIPIEVERRQLERREADRRGLDGQDALDGLDYFLRARALELIPPSPARSTEIRALYERALQSEPSSVPYRLSLVGALLNEEDQAPHGRKAVYERTASLLAEAQARDPGYWLNAFERLYWVYWQDNRRCAEVVDRAEQFLARYSRAAVAADARRWLGLCQIVLGHADTAVGVLELALAREPGPYRSRSTRTLQFALLLLGRLEESIRVGERALTENPDDVGYERARINRRLAAAYALSGHLDEARRKVAEAARVDPSFTARDAFVAENASPVYAAQVARYQEGLRLAGVRDHAEEDADFGVVPDRRLHQLIYAPTPLTLPGVQTIRTDALVRLLADRHPIVIDALENFSGPSLPGAVGLPYAGSGGELTDKVQDRLQATMRGLTNGDLGATVIVVGWNSETFDGRNLALRLVTLGYTDVSWYRGGRETWEVHGLPEAILTPTEW